jgi:hypothetical protein
MSDEYGSSHCMSAPSSLRRIIRRNSIVNIWIYDLAASFRCMLFQSPAKSKKSKAKAKDHDHDHGDGPSAAAPAARRLLAPALLW